MSSPMMNSNAMSYYKREDGEECYTYISYGLKKLWGGYVAAAQAKRSIYVLHYF